jgi:hypothetical protein
MAKLPRPLPHQLRLPDLKMSWLDQSLSYRLSPLIRRSNLHTRLNNRNHILRLQLLLELKHSHKHNLLLNLNNRRYNQ